MKNKKAYKVCLFFYLMDNLIPIKDFKEGEEVESELTPEGNIKFKRKKNVVKGRKARGAGGRFELKVRGDLEEKNFVVDKWGNNVDLDKGKVVIAKRKFNPFNRALTIGTGFPDFVCFQRGEDNRYNVIGVECKVNGLLSKKEKEKCGFLLKKKVFSEIWVAKKGEVRGKVEYIDFGERWGKKFLD